MKALPGRGVTAEIENDRLILGSSRLMEEEGIERGPLAARAEELESDGRSVSWIAATSPKKRLIGLLAFGDEAKTSAKEAIEILHRRGVRSIMLTGANAGSPRAEEQRLGKEGARTCKYRWQP